MRPRRRPGGEAAPCRRLRDGQRIRRRRRQGLAAHHRTALAGRAALVHWQVPLCQCTRLPAAMASSLASRSTQRPGPRACQRPSTSAPGWSKNSGRRRLAAARRRQLELDLAALAAGAEQAQAQLAPGAVRDQAVVRSACRIRGLRRLSSASRSVPFEHPSLSEAAMQAQAQLGAPPPGASPPSSPSGPHQCPGGRRHVQLALVVLARDGQRLGGGEVAAVAGQQAELDPHVARGGGLGTLIGEDQLLIVAENGIAQRRTRAPRPRSPGGRWSSRLRRPSMLLPCGWRRWRRVARVQQTSRERQSRVSMVMRATTRGSRRREGRATQRFPDSVHGRPAMPITHCRGPLPPGTRAGGVADTDHAQHRGADRGGEVQRPGVVGHHPAAERHHPGVGAQAESGQHPGPGQRRRAGPLLARPGAGDHGVALLGSSRGRAAGRTATASSGRRSGPRSAGRAR